MAKRKKNKTPWGVFGIILVIAGGWATIPFALLGGNYTYWVILPAVMVIAGLIIAAWAFTN